MMVGHLLTNSLKHRLVAQMRTMIAIYAVRDISVCHCFMNTRRDHFLYTNSNKLLTVGWLKKSYTGDSKILKYLILLLCALLVMPYFCLGRKSFITYLSTSIRNKLSARNIIFIRNTTDQQLVSWLFVYIVLFVKCILRIIGILKFLFTLYLCSLNFYLFRLKNLLQTIEMITKVIIGTTASVLVITSSQTPFILTYILFSLLYSIYRN
uniref:TPT domain-containing protein n=1 Tax=Heterorhabditis bacteriophora TaxID=37862 RepID=A0A1I7W8F4_HETBA